MSRQPRGRSQGVPIGTGSPNTAGAQKVTQVSGFVTSPQAGLVPLVVCPFCVQIQLRNPQPGAHRPLCRSAGIFPKHGSARLGSHWLADKSTRPEQWFVAPLSGSLRLRYVTHWCLSPQWNRVDHSDYGLKKSSSGSGTSRSSSKMAALQNASCMHCNGHPHSKSCALPIF